VIETVSNQLAGFFHARERVQTVYSREEQSDLTVPALYLNKLSSKPEIDAENGFLMFSCGTVVSEITALLANTPYLKEPFTSLNSETCIGRYFTHDTVFSSDSLVSLTVVLPDGRVMTLGKKAYASVAGYRAIDLFLGTKNLLGVPVMFTYKLQPHNLPKEMQNNLYFPSTQTIDLAGDDRRIILRLKTAYDPFHILNTFYL
jgi:hypothetical protein